jgi:hypothetical protein
LNGILSCFVFVQVPKKALREAATPSSVDVSHSSSYSAYCSDRPGSSHIPFMVAESDIKAAMKDAMDIIGQETKETDEFFTMSRQEIDELKNKQAFTENIVRNLLHSSDGKSVSCQPSQAP